MIDSILKKIGLGGNKPDIPVVNVKSKSLIDVLRDSGLSEANEKKLTLNGNNDSAVLIELDKVLIAKQCDSKKIVILFNDHTDIRDLFKIAVLFKVKKIFNFVNNDNNIN